MVDKRTQHQERSEDHHKIGRTILKDLRRGDLKRTLRRDLKDLYYFYLDEERRVHLSSMNRLKRYFLVSFWLLKSMILKLTPTRRILLLICFILFLTSRTSFQIGEWHFQSDLTFYSIILLLIILMLELKDKLLARDELMIGRAVQMALLPDRNPSIPGWEVWLFTRPANDVGGDLVDYVELDNNRLGVTIGDVAGKGLGAALLMAKLQATLTAFAPDITSLSELGHRLNETFCRYGLENRYATLIYLEMEPRSGLLKILNAGHMPPITLQSGVLKQLPPVASVLGMIPNATFKEQNVELQPGNYLVAYSDGLTEARNEQGDFFGEKRLLHLLPQLQDLSAKEFGQRLLEEVAHFAGEEPQNDDLSIILLHRLH